MSKLKCPNCGGERITVQLMKVGTARTEKKIRRSGNSAAGTAYNATRGLMAISTLGLSNLVMPKAKGSKRAKTTTKVETKAIMQKVCLCQECGHDWILN